MRLKTANVSMTIKMWHKMVTIPYGDKIDAGDVQYFLNKDLKEDLLALNQQNGIQMMNNLDEICDMIDNSFRKPLKLLHPNDLDACVEYLQRLCSTSGTYMSF